MTVRKIMAVGRAFQVLLNFIHFDGNGVKIDLFDSSVDYMKLSTINSEAVKYISGCIFPNNNIFILDFFENLRLMGEFSIAFSVVLSVFYQKNKLVQNTKIENFKHNIVNRFPIQLRHKSKQKNLNTSSITRREYKIGKIFEDHSNKIGKKNLTEQLLKHRRLLLCRCGDVETNPGPTFPFGILSYNMNGGMQLPKKQKRIIHKCLKAKIPTIYMFQETHLESKNEFVLRARWQHQLLASHHSNSSAGILILYKETDWDEVVGSFASDCGRFGYIILRKQARLFAFINMYFPNQVNLSVKFVKTMKEHIDNLATQWDRIGDRRRL